MKAAIVETPLVKSVGNKIQFQAESPSWISEQDARGAQTTLGYDPMGYGFNDFKVTRDPVLLRYRATWSCQANCD